MFFQDDLYLQYQWISLWVASPSFQTFFLIVKDPYWDANRNTKMQTAKSMDFLVGVTEIFRTKI